MAAGRLLVVINPKASRAGQSAGTALGALVAAGFALDVRPSGGPRDIAAAIRDAGSVRGVVVAGGDGTINAAIGPVLDSGLPLGILPLGTANDLALTLGIPTEPEEAAAVIARGRRRRIDVGQVNDRHFINVASLGISVAIAGNQDPGLKRQWGILSYAVAAFRTLGEAERFRAEIDCDGQAVSVETYQIAVGSGVHYGGGLRIAPGAAIDDGHLDGYALECASLADLVVSAPALADGSIGARDDVRAFRGKRITITTARPMPVNTDGEVTTKTPAEFSILPGALEVFAPPAG